MRKPKSFGGSWTKDKLDRIRRYMVEYTKILSKRPYHFSYVDGFAGSGYIANRKADVGKQLLFPEILEEETTSFIDGSARIALQVTPEFSEYIFIEIEKGGCKSLESLRWEFPEKAEKIKIIHGDANAYLQRLCKDRDWKKERCLVFVDPCGMTINWDTFVALASTGATDVWILFPIGMGVNRMLKKDGNIPECWEKSLDNFFGTHDWYDTFYHTDTITDLFGTTTKTMKVADFDGIGEYFVKRLETIFRGVAKNPLLLKNSTQSPLFLLCFATANPFAVDVSLRISQYILGREKNG